MFAIYTKTWKIYSVSHLLCISLLVLGGCTDEGPAIEAWPQTISFSPIQAPIVDQVMVTAAASASSGLPVIYSSLTTSVCTVDSSTGIVTGIASGTCTISANQAGNDHFAPAPQATQNVVFNFSSSLSFTNVPSMSLYDLATMTASDGSGQSVSYTSTTPAICTVDAASGLILSLATGSCTIVATTGSQQATQTVNISSPSAASPPGMPTGVSVKTGDTSNTVIVTVGGVVSGGSPISNFNVISTPSGISALSASLPITATCPTTCAGYSFAVTAANSDGTSPLSAFTDIVTTYKVITTFYEPDTQPNNSFFIGTFDLNSTTGIVTNLKGELSEAMTGGSTPYPNDTMTWLPLNNQLSSVSNGQGGVLVATFLNSNTNTFTNDPAFGGTDGWSPGTGSALYYGFPTPGANPGNAYALIFVNTTDPTALLTQTQIDKLAYADCAPGGIMGATCMTGTTVAGYGSVGTMSGYPVSQTITKQ
jgi:hypothetical protein